MLLTVEDLTMRYGGVSALDGVSVDVAAGSLVAVTGTNGSGKSTLFDCISGALAPTGGTIHLDGKRISGVRADRVARLGVARTFQNRSCFRAETVTDNILLGRQRYSAAIPFGFFGRGVGVGRGAVAGWAVDEILEVMGLDEVRDTRVSELPFGMAQLVEVARAMATEPRLLLLDEPVASFSVRERDEFLDRVTALREGSSLTILWAEHDHDLLRRVADREIALDRGRVVAREGASC